MKLSLEAARPLASLNTFGIAVQAERFAVLHSRDQLPDLIEQCRVHGGAFFLGGGSNILLTRDLPGLTVKVDLRGMEIDRSAADAIRVTVASGENWHASVMSLLEQGVPGLENLALIPGTVGAAPIQNIGAYGLEVSERIESVEVLDWQAGTVEQLDAQACQFAYRESVFKRNPGRWLVLSVTFRLPHPQQWHASVAYRELADELQRLLDAPAATATPQQVADAVIAIRSRKLPDPRQIGNAGSFFKNPVVSSHERRALLESHPDLVNYPQPDGSYKLAAGWLIDRCGWKGRQIGTAGVHANQALVLVNRGGASGADIMALAQAIQSDVHDRFGVTLEPEPVFL
ncbi:UDP-N-acetylenolpyruvoylglucosamine reductase [Oxalicibacterium flavum]|uniref:UDP-N-acetylenolpyruvoylglucosamine reductase n=1 Tax=Oxalicibacterium flavum TaxID=179467 RepID=A0A8J2UKL4_9BURK|nr:UDP-N-acetylmuramate dehydrogenase [Oxalicibacterium flavum]GGB96055.1 UDP-N-acetylenolpyruvoylglucosamine reductase [Oxalicibacterium flavum]